MITLDTHVAAWLHAGELKMIPASVQAKLERAEIAISPIVLLELEYLFEIGRLTVHADSIFSDLAQSIGLKLLSDPFPAVIRESLKQNWTRDPFDRMICAHALVGQHSLATKDIVIRRHCKAAFWS